MPLSMTKIAYTSKTVEQLRAWVERGEEAVMTTRYLPRRHEEMAGGSLYWIMDHTIVARSPIQGFGQAEDGRCLIRLAPRLIAVDPRHKRAHQGWRYLEEKNAPRDLDAGESPSDVLPGRLAGRLKTLGLI